MAAWAALHLLATNNQRAQQAAPGTYRGQIIRGRSKQRPYLRINLRLECSSDELVLALLSVIQVTNPGLLRAGADGFAVDLSPLEKKELLTSDELLVVRLHEVFVTAGDSPGPYAVELSVTQAARLGETLDTLARAREWPPDVQRMNRDLRARVGAPIP